MDPLSADRILALWEVTQRGTWTDRVVATLSVALPGCSRDDLTTLSVGECNVLLGRLRSRTFGSRLEAFATCPQCGERLEFSLDAAEMLQHAPLQTRQVEVAVDRFVVRARAVEVRDLEAASRSADVTSARQVLMQRCVLSAMHRQHAVTVADLPEPIVAHVSRRLQELDPGAEVLLDLGCPECGLAWTSVLDLGEFLWAEIGAYARRLLREVHTLARAYGWSEAAILQMPPARRAAYLSMVDQ